ncbi:MAG: hypothetical protein ABIF11_12550 [Nitrospirota bacterium]
MEVHTLPLKKRRITVSLNPEIYYQVFENAKVNKSQIIERALKEYQRIHLKRQIITFCSAKDYTDIEDAELTLPAQLEALDYD